MKNKTPHNKKNNFQKISFMPDDKEAISILKARSERYAINLQSQELTNNVVTYIRFRIGCKELYGIPYRYAKEVIHTNFLTRVPCVPSYIAGVMNRRGNLIAILDLKKLFEIEKINDEQKDIFIIVVTGNNMTIGILADQVFGSDFYESLDTPLPSEGAIKQDYIIGIHDGTTAIINIEAILSAPQFQLKNIAK